MTVAESSRAADKYLAQLYSEAPEVCQFVWEDLIHRLRGNGLSEQFLQDDLEFQLEMWSEGQKIDKTFPKYPKLAPQTTGSVSVLLWRQRTAEYRS